VPGVRVGHFTDSRRPTGCTAILFDSEATAGVDYDGSAPGSYLGVLLQPVSPIETIHGMLLTGGGPMGLGAVPGSVRYLEERKTGFDWGVPNVRFVHLARVVERPPCVKHGPRGSQCIVGAASKPPGFAARNRHRTRIAATHDEIRSVDTHPFTWNS